MAQRVGRGIVLLFHDRGTRRGEWSATRHGRSLSTGKTRYPVYRMLGGPQDRSGRGGKSRPDRDWIPDRKARSQSLYRLSYPAHVYIQSVPGGIASLREGFPYVKVYRYNPKHLCPNLNGYGDNGQ